MLLASVEYAGLVTVTAARAFAGTDPLAWRAFSGAVMAACLTALVIACTMALVGALRPRRWQTQRAVASTAEEG